MLNKYQQLKTIKTEILEPDCVPDDIYLVYQIP